MFESDSWYPTGRHYLPQENADSRRGIQTEIMEKLLRIPLQILVNSRLYRLHRGIEILLKATDCKHIPPVPSPSGLFQHTGIPPMPLLPV